MIDIEKITLKQYIECEQSLQYLYKLKPRTVEIEANIYIKKYMFYFNEIKYDESKVEEWIKKYSFFNINFLESISQLEYVPNINYEGYEIKAWVNEGSEIEKYEKVEPLALILSDLQDGCVEVLPELCGQFLTKNGALLSADEINDIPLLLAFRVKKYVESLILILCQLYNQY